MIKKTAKKAKVEGKISERELDKELDEIEEKFGGAGSGGAGGSEIQLKMSRPISKIKKGDKIKIDGKEFEVDEHYVLIDHGSTKEMAIEVFSGDNDYQIRYFNDNIEGTIELYELQGEIMFVKKPCKKIEF